MHQPGYDALASLYAETFPTAYGNPVERHAVATFAETVAQGRTGTVLDIGCGLGHVTADLVSRGLDVIGIEPSIAMIEHAIHAYPDITFLRDDARLSNTDLTGITVSAILARYSLIHLPPTEVVEVLDAWSAFLLPGSVVAVACQSTDEPDAVVEFDHLVAPAWRWHPDRLSTVLDDAGFDEVWRTVSRPDSDHRFPEIHLVARRRPRERAPMSR